MNSVARQNITIVDVLGAGGFGITYRAQEEFTGRQVAIKEFLPNGFALRIRDGIAHVNGVPDPLVQLSPEAHQRYGDELSNAVIDLTTTPFIAGCNSEAFQCLRAAHLRRDVTATPCEDCVAYR